jgi:aspartate/methionine/tyrosine aminotransferase
VLALQQLPEISARAEALLNKNRNLVFQFLDGRDDLEAVRPKFGTIVFPRLKRGSVERLCQALRELDTSVVPGRFFEAPEHFRLGFACDSDMLSQGLTRLGKALNEI